MQLEINTEEKMDCPLQPKGGPFAFPEGAHWRSDNSGYHSCSHCGSMHPQEFMQLVEEGVELGVTNKNYKVYIHPKDPMAGKEVVYMSSSSPAVGYVECTPENVGNFNFVGDPDYYIGKWVKTSICSETQQLKFYFEHLDEGQKKRFLTLLQENKLKFQGDLFFNPLPFFITRR